MKVYIKESSNDDMNSETWKDIQDLVKKTNFEPVNKIKSKIITDI